MGSLEWHLKGYSNVPFYSGLNRSGRFILCLQDLENGQPLQNFHGDVSNNRYQN